MSGGTPAVRWQLIAEYRSAHPVSPLERRTQLLERILRGHAEGQDWVPYRSLQWLAQVLGVCGGTQVGYDSWYEILPNGPVPCFSVSAGDSMTADSDYPLGEYYEGLIDWTNDNFCDATDSQLPAPQYQELMTENPCCYDGSPYATPSFPEFTFSGELLTSGGSDLNTWSPDRWLQALSVQIDNIEYPCDDVSCFSVSFS